MLEIVQGNLLEAEENLICHQVNCRGVMGTGLALALKTKYPKIYIEYRNLCTFNSIDKLIGSAQIVEVDSNKYIVNLFGQVNYGRGIVHTNYNALQRALNSTFQFAHEFNYSIAIPYNLGCGLAGGDWTEVLSIIQRECINFPDISVKLYKLK